MLLPSVQINRKWVYIVLVTESHYSATTVVFSFDDNDNHIYFQEFRRTEPLVSWRPHCVTKGRNVDLLSSWFFFCVFFFCNSLILKLEICTCGIQHLFELSDFTYTKNRLKF